MREYRGWDKRIKTMRVSTIAILVTLILLILFAGFTIYGNRVGNFIINVNNEGVQLALSVNEDLSKPTARLALSGIDGQRDATYTDIPDDIALGLGEKNDYYGQRYLAFSFYLINNSTTTVDYDMELNIIDTIGDPLSILRLMIIEGDQEKDTGIVYALPEATEEGAEQLRQHTDYTTTPHLSDTQIFKKTVIDLKPGDAVKYTVVIWIEGWDIECTDYRIGDRIKMELTFFGY